MDTPNSSPTPQSPQFDPAQFASKLDFVVPEAVLADLNAKTKFDAIAQLVASLARTDAIPAEREAEILAAVLNREELGTTAIGHGVAVPHARHLAISRVVAAIGFSPAGIDFDSLDRQLVHLLVLVLSPADAAAQSLRALQQVVVELKALKGWT
jgi:PTS system fructose-specific IIA component/PTS system nitrogen regulatory IIA component